MHAHSVMSSATPWTVVHQAPLSGGFPSQEYWSGLPFPTPGDLPHPGSKPVSCLASRFMSTLPPGKPLAFHSRLHVHCSGDSLFIFFFEDYDSGNLLGFFFSPLGKLHAKDTTYRISLNNTTPRQGQGDIWGRGILPLLFYVLFLILKYFYVPLDGISEMGILGILN